MGLWRIFSVFALLIALCGGCGRDSQYGRKLTGPEIQALFAGKTVEGHHEIDRYDFKSYYEPTGVFRSYQSDKTGARPAKWWVSGDLICIHRDDEPEELCRNMFVDPGGVYRKVLVTGRTHKVVVTFKSFTPGNPGNL